MRTPKERTQPPTRMDCGGTTPLFPHAIKSLFAHLKLTRPLKIYPPLAGKAETCLRSPYHPPPTTYHLAPGTWHLAPPTPFPQTPAHSLLG
jgi:hypothetical protein